MERPSALDADDNTRLDSGFEPTCKHKHQYRHQVPNEQTKNRIGQSLSQTSIKDYDHYLMPSIIFMTRRDTPSSILLRSLPPKWVLQEKVVILGHESRRRQQIG